MLVKVNADEYRKACNAVPEHPRRVQENLALGSPYYLTQKIFDSVGNLVAMHDDDGNHWASPTLATKS